MCRLLGYLGPPLGLRELVRGQPHSLYEQSYRPREMTSGTVNVDGFGVGWYVPAVDPTPVRYVSSLPLWADSSFDSLARKYTAECALAVARGATDGMGFGPQNTPPFAHERFLFAHNGAIANFRRTVMRPMRDGLRDAAYQTIRGDTDTEHLFGLFLDALGDDTEPDAFAHAARATVRRTADLATAHHTRAQLNLLATDGIALCATRYATDRPAPSLYYRAADAIYLASEPLTHDTDWREVPPDSVVLATRARGIEVTPL